MSPGDGKVGLSTATVTLRENLRIGFDALLAQKLRSLLTTLGIIFGVAAVIAMTSISAGAQSEILDAIQSLGVNNIIVTHTRAEDHDERVRNLRRNPTGLTEADAEALSELIVDADPVIPLRRVEAHLRMPRTQLSGIVGIPPEFRDVVPIELIAGRFITDGDELDGQPVALITEPLRRELFPLESPLGRRIKLDRAWFTVIGVIQPPLGGFTTAGLDMPDMSRDVYVPLSTLNRRFAVEVDTSPLDAIVMRVADEDQVRPVALAAERILDRRHKQADDVRLVVPVELLEQSKQTQRIFNIVMGAIASISLLVGGIGIMNIMLSNVVERTREIGVRRAMGATRADVVSQFLLEAVLLSLVGGAAGVVIGIGMAWGITLFAGWATAIGPLAVALAFTVSATVGIVFGWWPARKAADMDVINALRHE